MRCFLVLTLLMINAGCTLCRGQCIMTFLRNREAPHKESFWKSYCAHGMTWMLLKDSTCDYFMLMQQTEPLVGSTGSRYLGLCYFHHQGETNNWIFLSQTELTTSYRSVSPEFLGLLTGTSIQLAVNKGQEQQSLTPSSFSTASVQP